MLHIKYKMTTYMSDKMIEIYKILILYALRHLKSSEMRMIIWQKILIYEEENLEELLNQEGTEINLQRYVHEQDLDRDEIYDLYIEDSD